MFHGQQMAFEYKAWVETELARYGVQTLPWRYCSDSQKCLLDEAMDVQLVVRANRTDGGAGVALYDRRNGVLPPHDDRFVAVAPFLDGAIPLNVNGCVFPNGEVTVHGPSFQLIGLPTCSVRRFGYCGNDFAAFAQLDGRTVDAVEAMTLSAGRWLHSKGYCGAFGIDALLLGGLLYMAEVNPRFQGSSCLAAQLDAWLDIPDQYLCHLAAFLGITCPLRPRLRDVVVRQRRRAHVVVHNTSQEAMILDDSSAEMECRVHQLPGKTVRVLPDAILAELVLADQVTRDGFSVDTRTLRVVLGVKAHYRNAPT
jgi:predicted ATP-grasp superfamily ATP-dependent carboligase